MSLFAVEGPPCGLEACRLGAARGGDGGTVVTVAIIFERIAPEPHTRPFPTPIVRAGCHFLFYLRCSLQRHAGARKVGVEEQGIKWCVGTGPHLCLPADRGEQGREKGDIYDGARRLTG